MLICQVNFNSSIVILNRQVGAIIITPTRELAIQIEEVLSHFICNLPHLTVSIFIGGNNPIIDVERFISFG